MLFSNAISKARFLCKKATCVCVTGDNNLPLKITIKIQKQDYCGMLQFVIIRLFKYLYNP